MTLADALSGRAGSQGVLWLLREPPERRVLRHALGALLEPGRSLGPCRLRRAKFKPGRKLTAYYDVFVRARDGESTRRPIAATWPAAAEKADGLPDSQEMQAEARRARLVTPFAKLQSVTHPSGLRILVYPLDSGYPQLVRVSDPRHVHSMLAEAGRLGRGVPEYRVSVVRYRPGQRHVLRYDPISRGDGADRKSLFAKLYQNAEAGRAFRLATAIADWLRASGSPVQAVAPLRHVAADDLVLYTQAPGRPLSAAIARREPGLARLLFHTGEALRVLQGAAVALGGELPGHRFGTEIQTIARTSQHIQALLPAIGGRLRDVLDRATALYERLPQENAAFAHGDYKADHLLAHGDRLTLIDFDTCAMADPALDVGKFLADLRFWFAVSGRRGVEHAQRAFLDGYGPLPDHRMQRARLYEALVLTKITAHRLPLFSPAWAPDTARLVGVAHALLERITSP